MGKKVLIILALIAVFVGGIYLFYKLSFSQKATINEEKIGPLPDSSKAKVEDYIRKHISELSPEPEVLGGKFYVKKVEFLAPTRALVEYEDGHNAFKANADFFLDPPDFVKILNFTVIERN